MGSVKFDLKADEVRLKDISLSSVEDIHNFVDMLDLIYDEHLNGNTYATCLYVDFEKGINEIENNTYIMMFHDISIGKSPITQDEINQGIIEIYDVASYRLGIEKEEYVHNLNENIASLYTFYNDKWIHSINNNYKNKLITYEEKSKKNLLEVDYDKLKELDALKKYAYSRRTYQGKLPTEIKQLYEYRDILIEKINKLNKMKKKYYKKDNKRYNKYKSEASKLRTFKIQVDKDISILKLHYGIKIKNKNRQGQNNEGNNISYNAEQYSIVSAHEKYINQLKTEKYNELMDNIYVGKIKEIAEKCLTTRQFMIYELYYSIGLTQREIGDIMGFSQQAIQKELKIIIKKIIKNM